MSEEQKRKLSEVNKGKKLSEKVRNGISERMKGNQITKGMHWFNNGIEQILAFECPEGFKPGMLRKF